VKIKALNVEIAATVVSATPRANVSPFSIPLEQALTRLRGSEAGHFPTADTAQTPPHSPNRQQAGRVAVSDIRRLRLTAAMFHRDAPTPHEMQRRPCHLYLSWQHRSPLGVRRGGVGAAKEAYSPAVRGSTDHRAQHATAVRNGRSRRTVTSPISPMRKRIVCETKVHRGRRLGGIRSYNAVSRERVTVCVLAGKHIKECCPHEGRVSRHKPGDMTGPKYPAPINEFDESFDFMTVATPPRNRYLDRPWPQQPR
jgi:hypothetical protein